MRRLADDMVLAFRAVIYASGLSVSTFGNVIVHSFGAVAIWYLHLLQSLLAADMPVVFWCYTSVLHMDCLLQNALRCSFGTTDVQLIAISAVIFL